MSDLARLFRSRHAVSTKGIEEQAAGLPEKVDLSASAARPTIVVGATRRSKMTHWRPLVLRGGEPDAIDPTTEDMPFADRGPCPSRKPGNEEIPECTIEIE